MALALNNKQRSIKKPKKETKPSAETVGLVWKSNFSFISPDNGTYSSIKQIAKKVIISKVNAD